MSTDARLSGFPLVLSGKSEIRSDLITFSATDCCVNYASDGFVPEIWW